MTVSQDDYIYPTKDRGSLEAHILPTDKPEIGRDSNVKVTQSKFEKSTRFVIHEHKARRAGLHYDLRIQVGNHLKDWAFRKTIPEQVGVKRLGIKQDDHHPVWLDFEGTIEEGYGAGEITTWDKGDLILNSVEDKKIVGRFNGKKISGSYVLIEASKLGGWLMWKQAD